MNRKFSLGFVLGGIIALPGAARSVDGQGAVDYSVNSVPGSPGDSSGKTKMELDVKTHREAVRDANDAHQQAVASYGRDSQEAKETGRNLAEKHTQLNRNLYQNGQVPGSKYSGLRLPSQQDGKSTPAVPVRQVEF